MEVVENDNKESIKENNNKQLLENIPKLDSEESSFQLITKEQEKKEDQSFNASEKSDNNNQKSKIDKSTEENSISIISKKESKGINSQENNERKNSINLNIEVIKEEKYNDKKERKKKKMKLNYLTPEEYMGENIIRTDFNINPMEVKIKRLEKEIEKQNNYDYNKVMQEIKDKLENKKKREEQIKHIKEKKKKMKENNKNKKN